jgi:hypothetical protein
MYQGRKRVIYQEAADSLCHERVNRSDAEVKVFVKVEKTNFTSKADPAPRAIQPRTPRFNVEVGKYVKPLEKRLCHAIAEIYGGPTVMKGFTAVGVGMRIREMWDQFKRPVAIGLDASRFDQHVSVDALKWEHLVYLSAFTRTHRPELGRLLSWQLKNIARGYCYNGKVKYTVDGKRMSGDMNTGLGNCLLMCAMVWAYASSLGIRCRLANNGDDCTVIIESADLPRFMAGLERWFEEMGFTMKVEKPVTIFEQIEFCQAHPVFDGEQWVMVRSPVAFAKDAVSTIPLTTAGVAKQWMDAVGDCGLAMAGGFPICHSFYTMYKRSAAALSFKRRQRYGTKGRRVRENQELTETGMAMLARGMKRANRTITQAARFSYYLAFGITPDQQTAIEEELDKITVEYDGGACHDGRLRHLFNFPGFY